MAVGQIAARPWEQNDPERISKFHKGTLGKTADRWTARPEVEACWRGDYRDWHIEDGRHYQEQLYCKFWETFVNPSGLSCEACKDRKILDWHSPHLQEALSELIEVQGKEVVGQIIVNAVRDGQLSKDEALELVDEFDLETTN